jgi:putative uncharacterized protein (fragment)
VIKLFTKGKAISPKYSLHLTGAACIGNFVVGTGKLIMGLIFLSFFTCVSAFYTYGMVVAKICVLKGMGQDRKKQYAHYRLTGIILMAASVLYAIYAARLLWYPEVTDYERDVALAIATFTFTEIGLNIRGVAVESKNQELLYHALKMVNLASALTSLVLTQTALLAFTHKGAANYNASFYNGAIGLLMGGGLYAAWAAYAAAC